MMISPPVRAGRGYWSVIVGGLLALGLAGCASTGSKESAGSTEAPAAATVNVEARSKQRWEALLAKDYAAAYQYLTPGERSKLTAERYGAQVSVLPVKWSSAEVLDSECDGERCDVRVNLGFRVRSHLPGVGWIDSRQVVVEKWLRLDGAWYYLPESAG